MTREFPDIEGSIKGVLTQILWKSSIKGTSAEKVTALCCASKLQYLSHRHFHIFPPPHRITFDFAVLLKEVSA